MPRYRGDRTYFAKIVTVVGGYLRAQLIVSAISALLVGIPAALFGLPFALLLGLLAGLLNMVPSLGAILSPPSTSPESPDVDAPPEASPCARGKDGPSRA